MRKVATVAYISAHGCWLHIKVGMVAIVSKGKGRDQPNEGKSRCLPTWTSVLFTLVLPKLFGARNDTDKRTTNTFTNKRCKIVTDNSGFST